MFSVGGARLAGLLVTAVTFPYLVRHLGVEMYGLWSYVIALCAFMDNVSNPGLTVYASQQVAAGRESAFGILPDVLVLRLLSSTVAAGALLVLAAFEGRSDVRHLILGYGIGVLFVNLLGSDYLLNALELFHARSLLTLIQQLLYATGILSLVKSPRDIAWVPASILGSAAITGLAGWGVLWRKGLRIPWTVQPSRWKGIIVPSAHYAASALMSNFYHRTGHIVVRWFLGDYALGLYAAVVRLVDILRGLVTILPSVFVPRIALAARTKQGLPRLARIAVSVTALVSVPMTFGLIATAGIMVPLVLGSKYAEAVSLIPWAAGYLIAAPAAALFSGTLLYAMGRHRAYLASTAAGAIAGVLLYLVLTPALGVKGAALAFVLSEVVVAAVAYVLVRRDLPSLWKNPVIALAAASSLVMIAVVLLLARYHPHPVVVVTTGVAVYAAGCWVLGRRWLLELAGGRH